MAQTAMTVRMDNQQKAQFDKLCEQFGMSANTAINIFVKAVIRSKSIPFSIQAKNEEDEVTAKAKAAFKQLRAKAERGETPELTLDEINEEISKHPTPIAIQLHPQCLRGIQGILRNWTFLIFKQV